MKLLTISIPTYNRANYLEELLDSIYLYWAQGSEVSVYVSDNSSTDRTAAVLKRFSLLHPESFSYNVLPANFGPDVNFLKCLTEPSSQYVWLLGSDDLLHAESISTVCHSLRLLPNVDLHLFSRFNFINDVRCAQKQVFCRSTCLDTLFCLVPNPQASSLLHYFNSAHNIGASFTYISSCVASSSGIRRLLHFYQPKFFGSAYIHVELFLSMLKFGSVLATHSCAIVLNRCGNDSFVDSDRSRRRIIDYKLASIARHVFGSRSALYSCYCNLLARTYLNPLVAIGDQSRALRDGGRSSLATLNAMRNTCFADKPFLSFLSRFYGVVFQPRVLNFLYRFCML